MALTLGLKLRISNLTALIAAVLTTGLQAWHKFTATTWTGANRLPDSSPGGTNTAALYTGRGLSFDGVNDVVTIGATGVTVKTVVFYAYPDTTTQAFMQLQSSGAVRIEIATGTLSATGFTSPTLYVNGAASSTVAATTWQQIAVTSATGVSASNVLLGQSNTTYLSGDLSNVKFFSTELSAAQIAELYANPEQALPTGSVAADLVGWWRLLEISSQSFAFDAKLTKSGLISGASPVTAQPSPLPQFSLANQTHQMWFDHSNDYIDLGTRSASSQLSFYFKVFVNSTTGSANGFFTWGKTRCISTFTNLITFDSDYDITPVAFNSGFTFAAGVVQHYIITQSGTSLKLYQNGTHRQTVVSNVIDTASSAAYLGRGLGSYLGGTLYEFAYWNVELTAGECLDVYNGTPQSAQSSALKAWHINNGTDNAAWVDLSGNSVNGTVNGSPNSILVPNGTTANTTPTGYNVRNLNNGNFIGNSTGYATITDAATLDITTNITLEAWVKPFAVSSAQTIIGKNSAYALGITAAGKPVFTKWTSAASTATATTTTTVTAYVWTHLAATYDGTNVKIYINGTLNTTTAVSGAIDATATDVLLGALTSSTELFNGYIDSAKVYSAALTASQVLTNYTVEATEYA